MPQTITRAKIAPFTRTEWAALRQCSKTLHLWAEKECNGDIQYDENGNPRRMGKDRWGSSTIQGSIIPDKSETAMEKARAIAAKHGLSVYEQTDPRGCALYVYSAADLKGRDIRCCYSTIGHPVV